MKASNKIIKQLLARKPEVDERSVLEEVLKRETLIAEIRRHLFDKQLEFIDDPEKLKALQCDRRASKSYTAGANFLLCGLENPGVSMLYITMTREMAKKIMFKDILKAMNKKFKIGLQFNETTLAVTFPNGAMLYLMGLDATPDEVDKALGQKYKLVITDESASYKQDQRQMIYASLLPAMADLDGTICMIGAAANNTSTLYFDIVGRAEGDPKREPGWKIFKWSWRDNPHTCHKVQKIIDKLIRANPLVVETAWFKQMYCNEWVIDAEALCYKYTFNKNNATELPSNQEYFYTISVDLGYEDTTAFTIAAYSKNDPNMYFVDAYERKGMDITDVANMTQVFKDKYKPVKYVIDGAHKQSVEELKKRYHFPFVAADKTGKSDIIELMNADFIMAKIKVLPAASKLVELWGKLIWDPKSQKREELALCSNNLPDSALYNWRMCYHYASKPAVKKITPGSEQEIEEFWEKEARKVEKIKKKGQSAPWVNELRKEYGFK